MERVGCLPAGAAVALRRVDMLPEDGAALCVEAAWRWLPPAARRWQPFSPFVSAQLEAAWRGRQPTVPVMLSACEGYETVVDVLGMRVRVAMPDGEHWYPAERLPQPSPLEVPTLVSPRPPGWRELARESTIDTHTRVRGDIGRRVREFPADRRPPPPPFSAEPAPPL
eukprot:EG_transcript_24980